MPVIIWIRTELLRRRKIGLTAKWASHRPAATVLLANGNAEVIPAPVAILIYEPLTILTPRYHPITFLFDLKQLFLVPNLLYITGAELIRKILYVVKVLDEHLFRVGLDKFIELAPFLEITIHKVY